jgi:hypothetical protein
MQPLLPDLMCGGRLTAPSREVTEAKLNGFAATVTAARFDTDAY